MNNSKQEVNKVWEQAEHFVIVEHKNGGYELVSRHPDLPWNATFMDAWHQRFDNYPDQFWKKLIELGKAERLGRHIKRWDVYYRMDGKVLRELWKKLEAQIS